MGLLRAGQDKNAASADQCPAHGATRVKATARMNRPGPGWPAGLLECKAGGQFTPLAGALAQQIAIEQAGGSGNWKPSFPMNQCFAKHVAG